MNDSVLFCTVGGSPQPILKAIESTVPCFICFFCSGTDPESGKPGSSSQVMGIGNVIKAHPGDEKATLPNIPTLAGLDPRRFDVVEVSSDDLDRSFIAMRIAIAELRNRFHTARFVADYTGGTKTMTAALVCAALESNDIELQLVAGARPDLERVRDGTEQAMTASVARLRLDRAMAPYLATWGRFAYREAAEGLDRIRIGVGEVDRRRLGLARAMSHSLALWDDFDHRGALDRIKDYARLVVGSFPGMLPTLGLLTQERLKKNEPARLFDLWLNARRRAAQGRYDDAVARVYRLFEWTAQWQLRCKLNLETARFPIDRLPESAKLRSDEGDHTKIGLFSAWQVIASDLQGDVREFAVQRSAEMCNLLSFRNDSILAHGFRPVREEDWRTMESWVEERFVPMLWGAAQRSGLKAVPEQLPTEPPECIRRFERAGRS